MNVPRRPEGSGSGTGFFQWVWDKLAKELRFADSPDIKWQRTTNGLSAFLSRRPPQSGGSEGMRFRGLYGPDTQYSSDPSQDVVVFTPEGGQAGMYICISTPPIGTPPDTGAPYWFAWVYPTPGVWGA